MKDVLHLWKTSYEMTAVYTVKTSLIRNYVGNYTCAFSSFHDMQNYLL